MRNRGTIFRNVFGKGIRRCVCGAGEHLHKQKEEEKGTQQKRVWKEKHPILEFPSLNVRSESLKDTGHTPMVTVAAENSEDTAKAGREENKSKKESSESAPEEDLEEGEVRTSSEDGKATQENAEKNALDSGVASVELPRVEVVLQKTCNEREGENEDAGTKVVFGWEKKRGEERERNGDGI